MSIVAHLTVDPPGGRRTAGRRRIRLGARRVGGEIAATRDIEIHDLSPGGCSFASRDPIAPGTALRLNIPHAGEIAARVSWAGNAQVGCAFDRALPPDALAAALAHSPVIWGDFVPTPGAPADAAAAPSPEMPARPRRGMRLAMLAIAAGLVAFWWLVAAII